jgi:DNA-binding response OmpR family regulator
MRWDWSTPGSRNLVFFVSLMPERSRRTVLVVEEDQQLRKLIGVILDGAGYRVVQARNGRDAGRLLGGECDDVDLVILDGLKGRPRTFAACAKYLFLIPNRVENPENPVLQKPFKPAALVEAVRAALDQAG